MKARSESGSRPPAGGGWEVGLAAAAIVAACAGAFGNGIAGAFVYDDTDALVRNPAIRSLWPPWEALFPRPGLTVSGRPLLSLSFALNYAVSGLAPWSYHAANIAIHACAALFLFGLIRRTLGLAGNGPAGAPVGGPLAGDRPAAPAPRFLRWCRPPPQGADATLFAAVAALVWAVHPLQTESVTYIVQRAESLAGLFILASLYCCARSIGRASGGPARGARKGDEPDRWRVLAWVACLLGVATKEVAVVIPVLALLYDRAFAAGSFGEALRKRRLLHGGLFASWVPLLALLATQGWNRHGAVGVGTGVTPLAYGLTQPEALVHYLALAAWPHPLVFDYGTFWVGHASEVIPQSLAVAALLAASLAAVRFLPAAGYLGAWFFLILAPTSLVPGTTQMIVEHRMYLPLAAVTVLAAGIGWAAVGRRWLWGMAGAAVVLGALTFARNEDYRSELTLWTKTVAERPGNAEAQYGVGHALLLAGRADEAIPALQRALALNPVDASIRNNLGLALLKTGRLDEALGQFAQAVRLKPADAWTRSDYAVVLRQAGRLRESADESAIAVRLQPGSGRLHENLAVVLGQLGRLDEALGQAGEAVRLSPGDPTFRALRGRFLAEAGRIGEAIGEFEEALRIDPDADGVAQDLAKARALQATAGSAR